MKKMDCPLGHGKMDDTPRRVPISHMPGASKKTLKDTTKLKTNVFKCSSCGKTFAPMQRLVEVDLENMKIVKVY